MPQQVNISVDTAYQEALIENQWLKNRILILAQQLTDAKAEIENAKNLKKRNSKVEDNGDTV